MKTRSNLRQFNYTEVAHLDARMWRSYYNHQFLLLFGQLLQLIRKQLGLSLILSIRCSYYAAWAAADYRINRKQVNAKRVQRNLIKFYEIVSMHATESFDYVQAGSLELVWWDIHRASKVNNKQLEQSLAAAAAAMYNTDAKRLKDYAHYRAEAMLLPRHEGDKHSFTDWDRVTELLVRAWHALHSAVQTWG